MIFTKRSPHIETPTQWRRKKTRKHQENNNKQQENIEKTIRNNKKTTRKQQEATRKLNFHRVLIKIVSFGSHFGPTLEPFWSHFGLQGALGALLGAPGRSLGHPVRFWSLFGAFLESFWTHLGSFLA